MINHVVTMEDYRFGHRIRSYKIEGLANGNWKELCAGQSVGRKKIDYFPDTEVSKIRIKVLENVGTPLIRNLSAYFVEDFVAPKEEPLRPWSQWTDILKWNKNDFAEVQLQLKIDLSEKINLPGQFTVKLTPENTDDEIEIIKAEIHYEGQKALDEFVSVKGNEVNINRTAMVTDESSSVLYVTVKCKETCNGKVEFRPAIIY